MGDVVKEAELGEQSSPTVSGNLTRIVFGLFLRFFVQSPISAEIYVFIALLFLSNFFSYIFFYYF